MKYSYLETRSRHVNTSFIIDEVEQCNLISEVGMLMIKTEWEILFMTIRNDITSSCLPFKNSVSTRFSYTN